MEQIQPILKKGGGGGGGVNTPSPDKILFPSRGQTPQLVEVNYEMAEEMRMVYLFLSNQEGQGYREEGDNGLFIILVPKVL